MNFHYKRLLVHIRKNFIVRNLLSYFKNVYQRTTYANSGNVVKNSWCFSQK